MGCRRDCFVLFCLCHFLVICVSTRVIWEHSHFVLRKFAKSAKVLARFPNTCYIAVNMTELIQAMLTGTLLPNVCNFALVTLFFDCRQIFYRFYLFFFFFYRNLKPHLYALAYHLLINHVYAITNINPISWLKHWSLITLNSGKALGTRLHDIGHSSTYRVNSV